MVDLNAYETPWFAMDYLPSPNRGGYQGRRRVRCVTWHITEGGKDASIEWLRNPISAASANFVLDRDGGVTCLVPPGETAWSNGIVQNPDRTRRVIQETVAAGVNPNLVTVSIECVGNSSHGMGGSLTQQQAAMLVQLTAWLCCRFGLSADRAHIFGHYQWDGVTRAGCPGFSAAEWERWIADVATVTHEKRGW